MYNCNVCGKMEFTREDKQEGKLQTFLNTLIDLGCEIRIWTDCGGCSVVEYIQDFRVSDGTHFILEEDVPSEIEVKVKERRI